MEFPSWFNTKLKILERGWVIDSDKKPDFLLWGFSSHRKKLHMYLIRCRLFLALDEHSGLLIQKKTRQENILLTINREFRMGRIWANMKLGKGLRPNRPR